MNANVPFFRETGVAGNQTLVSPVFGLPAFGSLVTAFKVVALAGTVNVTLDLVIEHSADRDRWTPLTTFTQVVIGVAPAVEIKTSQGFARFVRAKVTTGSSANDVTATFSVLAIARDELT